MNTALKRIFGYTKPYRKYFYLAVISAFIGVILSLIVPILTGKAVDMMIGADDVDFKGLAKLAAIMTAIILASTFFQWIMTLCTNQLSYRTARDIRCDIFEKLNHLPLKYIDSHSKGNITGTVINDMEIVYYSTGYISFTGIYPVFHRNCNNSRNSCPYAFHKH